MADMDAYKDKFSESGWRVLENALNEARRRENRHISPEHIIYALMKEEPDLFNEAMLILAIDSQNIRLAVEKRLENNHRHTGENFRIAPETTDIFKYSMDKARSENRRRIKASDMCFALTVNKYHLLNDILQNPEGDFSVSKLVKPAKVNQSYVFSQLKVEPSNFFADFSLENLVKNNTSPSGQLFANCSGSGGGSSGNNAEQTTHNKHETLFYRLKTENSDKFDEKEFISSLEKDVETDITQSGLKITRAERPDLSSFRFFYEFEKLRGQIEIFGEMQTGYYDLQAVIVEKTFRDG